MYQSDQILLCVLPTNLLKAAERKKYIDLVLYSCQFLASMDSGGPFFLSDALKIHFPVSFSDKFLLDSTSALVQVTVTFKGLRKADNLLVRTQFELHIVHEKKHFIQHSLTCVGSCRAEGCNVWILIQLLMQPPISLTNMRPDWNYDRSKCCFSSEKWSHLTGIRHFLSEIN